MKNVNRNILYVAHERKLGGASISLIALINQIQKKGHQIWVIVPTNSCPVARELKRMGCNVIPIFMPWWQMPSYWNLFSKLCFWGFYQLEFIEVLYALYRLRHVKIDIVHSNSSVIDIGAKIAKHKKCKHIWHIREFGDADYSLQCLKGKIKTWNYIQNHSDKVIFISKALYHYFDEYTCHKNDCVIYNGVDEKYKIEKKYKEHENIIFLIAGNLNKNKKQDIVLKAAHELLHRDIHNFRILIAGTSSSMSESKLYEKQLQEYIDAYLMDNATMLGSVKDTNQVRQNADVEIVASNKEAFGRVTIEAMFAGMPVIVSDTGANIELIQNGVQGVFFKNNDYIDLANQMEMFIKSPNRIVELGSRAYQYATNLYTATKNGDMINAIYLNGGSN